MNVILIIAAVIAVIASAARSRKGSQNAEQEAWPTDIEPQTVCRKPREYHEMADQRPHRAPFEAEHTATAQPKRKTRKQTKGASEAAMSQNRVAEGRFAPHTPITNPHTEKVTDTNEAAENEQHELIRNFDAQQAIIYAEIMKPKFEEYE